MMLREFGRRGLSWHKVVMPLVSVSIFGYLYLKHLPTNTAAEWAVYGIALALGLVFAAVATLTTKVQRNATTGR